HRLQERVTPAELEFAGVADVGLALQQQLRGDGGARRIGEFMRLHRRLAPEPVLVDEPLIEGGDELRVVAVAASMYSSDSQFVACAGSLRVSNTGSVAPVPSTQRRKSASPRLYCQVRSGDQDAPLASSG